MRLPQRRSGEHVTEPRDGADRLAIGVRRVDVQASAAPREALQSVPMPDDQNPHHPSRTKTDKSLSDERARTDEEIRRSAREASQSDAVETAAERQAADERIATVRAEADDRIGGGRSQSSGFGKTERKALEVERRTEDATVEEERQAVDARRKSERAAQAEAVAHLFQRERGRTDAHLAAERGDVDRTVELRLRYLGMLAHDLRGMLTNIGLQVAMLTREFAQEGEASKTFVASQRIRRVTSRMDRLLSDLIDVSALDSGVLPLFLREGDLTSVVSEVAESFQVTAQEAGIGLGLEVRDIPLLARFDYDRILQVLANLVGNALKFTPRGGRVSIEAERQKDVVRLAVVDTGPGVPPRDREIIFEPFQQLAPGRASKGGTGLGLHISRTLVEAHGGRIWVEAAPGGGSRFTFEFPAGASSRQAPRGMPNAWREAGEEKD